jgi:hypothetical protein
VPIMPRLRVQASSNDKGKCRQYRDREVHAQFDARLDDAFPIPVWDVHRISQKGFVDARTVPSLHEEMDLPLGLAVVYS